MLSCFLGLCRHCDCAGGGEDMRAPLHPAPALERAPLPGRLCTSLAARPPRCRMIAVILQLGSGCGGGAAAPVQGRDTPVDAGRARGLPQSAFNLGPRGQGGRAQAQGHRTPFGRLLPYLALSLFPSLPAQDLLRTVAGPDSVSSAQGSPSHVDAGRTRDSWETSLPRSGACLSLHPPTPPRLCGRGRVTASAP